VRRGSGLARTGPLAQDPGMDTWWVYILECADGSLYTGIARDAEHRLAEHNAGRGARYTRTRRPVRLLYREDQPSQGDALKREAAIKRWNRTAKLRLVARGTG